MLALAVRVVYALVAERVDPFLRSGPLHGDAASYDQIVRSLLAGGGYAGESGQPTAFWPPLYPFFLTGVYSVFGYHLLAARLVQAFLGAITVATTSLVAGEISGRRVGTIAGLGMALYPHLIYFGAWLTAEALYLSLLGLALLTAVRLRRRPHLAAFAALGALLGLAILAKPSALMLLPLICLWVLVGFPSTRCARRMQYLGMLLLMSVMVVAPWTARNYFTFGDVVLVSTNGGYTFYGANNADAFGGHRERFPPALAGLTEVEAEGEYYRQGLRWILSNPDRYAWLVGRKLVRLVSPLSVASFEHDFPLPQAGLVKTAYGVFLLAALAGLLRSLPRWRQVLILYILPVSTLASAVLFYGDARYTLPAVPALVIFAACSTATLRHGLPAKLIGSWRSPAASSKADQA